MCSHAFFVSGRDSRVASKAKKLPNGSFLKTASESISRVLSLDDIYLERASPRVSSTQPECTEGRPYGIPICACSRWGFPSHVVANALVRSYRTVSAFLLCRACGSHRMFRAGESSFLWHFPSGRPAQPLAGILPCGARTFLTWHLSACQPRTPALPACYSIARGIFPCKYRFPLSHYFSPKFLDGQPDFHYHKTKYAASGSIRIKGGT